MPSKVQVKNHLLYIDSIRALAAIYVVMHHAILQYFDTSANHFQDLSDFHLSTIKKLTIQFLYHGHYAVDLFIVVSGFSLMLSVTKNSHLLKGGSWLFFKRRIIRILPPYYFAILLSLILIGLFIGHKTGTHWDVSIPVTYKDVIAHIFVINDFLGTTAYRINHAFWSIAVEFRIYLFFPLLVWIWRKAGFFATFSVAVLISVVGTLVLLYLKQTHPNVSTDSVGVSPYIILFTFGMLAADIAFSTTKIAASLRNFYLSLSPAIVIAAVLGFLFICAFVKQYFVTGNIYLQDIDLPAKIFDILLGLFFAYILFVCAIPTKKGNSFWLVNILSWRPLIFIGSFSYSLYLIHSPLLAVLSEYVLAPLNLDRYLSGMLLATVGTGIIIILSYFFFYVFERPFLTMGKKAKTVDVEVETVINPAL